jgi:hypothetical protein
VAENAQFYSTFLVKMLILTQCIFTKTHRYCFISDYDEGCQKQTVSLRIFAVNALFNLALSLQTLIFHSVFAEDAQDNEETCS